MTKAQRLVCWLTTICSFCGAVLLLRQVKFLFDLIPMSGDNAEVLLVSMYVAGLIAAGSFLIMVYTAYMLAINSIYLSTNSNNSNTQSKG
jgi:hypothetical protein